MIMDYEKLHKYTINKLQQMVSCGKITVETARGICADFVPESEDERIRGAIVDHLKDNNLTEWAAWLEKQGKNNMGISEATKQELEDNLNKALEKETPDSWNKFLDEQKPADKIEPKFKVGDWVVRDGKTLQISGIDTVLDGTFHYWFTKGTWLSSKKMENAMLWTIQDAKAGDVLCNYCEEYDNPLIFILKKFERVDFGLAKPSDYSSYCFLTAGDRQIFKEGKYHHKHNIKPATREQRDLLFAKMEEAGYEWDAEKKELKKVEQNPAEDKGMNLVEEEMTPFQKKVFCIIDTTIEEEQGLKQVCDELLRLAHDEIMQNTAWSEEDEIALGDALWCCKQAASIAKDENDMGNVWYAERWLKSLKDRILPQQKQEWSEEDSNMLQSILDEYKSMAIEKRNWLKSLRPQHHWKPSNEQMKALKEAVDEHFDIDGGVLWHLYEQLKKLREE